jgi:uncharacterized protein (DUF1697 family)
LEKTSRRHFHHKCGIYKDFFAFDLSGLKYIGTDRQGKAASKQPMKQPRYISLLRGINLLGHKKIAMAELRALYESLGFKEAKTYIQSGNVIFSAPETDIAALVHKIEKKIKLRLGYDVSVIIRTAEEIRKIVEKNPFAGKEASKLHLTFLAESPDSFPAAEVDKVRDKAERYVHSGREIYLFLPNGYGRTKLNNNFFERKLKVTATTRSWRTVIALAEMAEAVR